MMGILKSQFRTIIHGVMANECPVHMLVFLLLRHFLLLARWPWKQEIDFPQRTSSIENCVESWIVRSDKDLFLSFQETLVDRFRAIDQSGCVSRDPQFVTPDLGLNKILTTHCQIKIAFIPSQQLCFYEASRFDAEIILLAHLQRSQREHNQKRPDNYR